jgi:hypothetical protein
VIFAPRSTASGCGLRDERDRLLVKPYFEDRFVEAIRRVRPSPGRSGPGRALRDLGPVPTAARPGRTEDGPHPVADIEWIKAERRLRAVLPAAAATWSAGPSKSWRRVWTRRISSASTVRAGQTSTSARSAPKAAAYKVCSPTHHRHRLPSGPELRKWMIRLLKGN